MLDLIALVPMFLTTSQLSSKSLNHERFQSKRLWILFRSANNMTHHELEFLLNALH